MLISPVFPNLVSDVTVVGAGVAGAALALAIRQAAPAARVDLLDPVLAGAPDAFRPASLRAIAVAPDSQALLERLGLWRSLAPHAQPIRAMRITDGRTGELPNPAFLNFDTAAGSRGPLAHMVLVDPLRRALVLACAEVGVRLDAARVLGFRDGLHRLDLEGETAGSTRLLVAADGGRSRLRHAARIRTLDRSYGCQAITATLRHERPHGGQAIQHFLPAGPLALLPLRDPDGGEHWTSIVWTEAPDESRRLLQLDPAGFLEALEGRIGLELGPLTLVDRPRAHDLGLMLARDLTRPRFALVGDAARTIHPLAGQGLNLALRDVFALSEAVVGQLALGLDPGAPSVLDRYGEARRFDAGLMAATTDGLDRLFSNDRAALRAVRDFGLSMVDRTPRAKGLLMRRAMGLQPGPGPHRDADTL